jgi:hypothetical protein
MDRDINPVWASLTTFLQVKANLNIRPVRADFPANPPQNSSTNSSLALEKRTNTTQQRQSTTRRRLPNIVALALLPTPCWCCHPHHAGIFGVSSLLLQWRPLCPRCAGVVAVAALASAPSSRWHCCCSCAGVVTLIALASSPLASLSSLHRCFCRRCSGAINVVFAVGLQTCLRTPVARGSEQCHHAGHGVDCKRPRLLATWGGGGEGITTVTFSSPLPSSSMIPPHSC